MVNACPFLMYLDVSSCTKLTSHMFDVPVRISYLLSFFRSTSLTTHYLQQSLDAEQLDGDEDENVLALQVLLVRNCNIANSFLKVPENKLRSCNDLVQLKISVFRK